MLTAQNGVICPSERYLQREQGINDQFRINYFKGYVNAIVEAIEEGTVVKSYIGWSLLDNFEWQVSGLAFPSHRLPRYGFVR